MLNLIKQLIKSFLLKLRGVTSNLFKAKISNPWTVSDGEFDVGKWQVGFKEVENCLIIGIFDHIIEADNKFSNILQDTNSLLAESAYALGKEYPFIFKAVYVEKYNTYDEACLENNRVQSILDNFGRWGRNPDEIADWLLFSKTKDVEHGWYKDLINEDPCLSVKINNIIQFIKPRDAVVLWAVDGHLYGAFNQFTKQEIQKKLIAISDQRKLKIANHQNLIIE